MAFSLEAAIITPLAIATWLGMTLAVVPVGAIVRQTACLEIRTTHDNLANQHLYQVEILRAGKAWTAGLQTSPHAVRELGSLIRDDAQMIARGLSGLLSGTAGPTGNGS